MTMELPGRNHLAEMPLHAITEMYGFDGLRARFDIEIAGYSEQDRQMVTNAFLLASELHRDDTRQREPYINHLLRVAIRISSNFDIKDAELIAAALLHDSVEDHSKKLGGVHEYDYDTALHTVSEWFSPRTARIVSGVTNPPPKPDIPSDQQPEQYRTHVRVLLDDGDWECVVVKTSDQIDNFVGLIYTGGPNMARFAAKYLPLADDFEATILTRQDIPITDAARKHILEQFALGRQRAIAILSDVK